METRLESIGRVTGVTNPNANKFPETLSKERTIIIKIYNTAEDDPNKLLATTAGKIVNAAKKAFNSTSTIEKTKETAESLGDLLGDVQSRGEALLEFFSVAYDEGKAVIDTTKDAYSEYAKGFKDVGNVGLAGRDGVPIWMDSLYLPLPNELTESLNHTYSETEGFAQTGAVGVATGAISSPAAGASNIASKATGRQALIKNANKLAQFDGSAFRKLSLSWTLIANNSNESLAIQNIITKLKAYSSPQAVSGKLLLRAPFFCKLEFPNKVIQSALQFNECVIESIEVNYSTSGHMETFTNNLPKTMSLSISFQDREPKTLQAWAEGQGGYEAN